MLEHPSVQAMAKLAKQLGIAIPTSFFERDGSHFYNTLAMIDANGEILGTYRKSHIPDGPGYQEKYYFRPGNTGFKVWNVVGVHIGVGICWDQWYPEVARAMALMGAELLFYPTAIGAEPQDSTLDTRHMWRRAMVGHAVSNTMPVIAANRTGNEDDHGGGTAEILVAPASSPMNGAISLPISTTAKPACWWRRSISTRRAPTAPAWASSATVGRSFTDGWWRMFKGG